jgi:hypothetical protein
VNRNDYATHSDFCVIFREQLDSLFLLALLLAGNELIAEKCFLAAFDSCAGENRVFKESALSWSRRTVIKSAIRMVLPASGNSSGRHLPGDRNGLDLDDDVLLKCVQELPPFDRFVFVMSMLERYSDRECALLLNCSCADILPARMRALRYIARRVEKRSPGPSAGTQPYAVDPDALECG